MIPGTLVTRLAAVLGVCVGPALATDWYVDVNGTPPGTGTFANPYTSIQYAHDQATTVDFDTILVLPGTYFENLSLHKPVTVRSTGGADATTLRPAASGAILTLVESNDNFDLLVFEGFRITGVSGPPNTPHVNFLAGKLLRCIVSGDLSGDYRGCEVIGVARIVDCTILGHGTGVLQTSISYVSMINTIIWNCGSSYHFQTGMAPDIEYCAMGGPPPFGGIGNVLGNPGLCYGWTGDGHLVASSICIDTGDPMLPNDPDGSRSDIGCFPFDPQYVCAPYTEFCPGDGSTAACPCGNSGSYGRGCDNSQAGTGGAQLYAQGTTSPDAVVLHAFGEMPTALTIFLQGNATAAPGFLFGDGLRCATGILKRLYVKNASGGAVHAPGPGDPSITTRSAALGDPIPPGERRYYQTYYRDANASFCPIPQGNTFNASSGVKIVW